MLKVARLLLLLMVAAHLGYLLLKTLQGTANADAKSPERVRGWLQKELPPKSRLVGSPQFYYAVMDIPDAEFQYIDRYNSPEERERLHREAFRYTHLLISDILWQRNPDLVNLYLHNAQLDTVSVLRPVETDWSKWLHKWLPLSPMERKGYAGVLLKTR